MTVVAIDIETTGLGHRNYPPREDAVIQVGIAWKEGNCVKIWSEYCNPGSEFFANGRADAALRINKITLETINNAKPASKVAFELSEKIEEIENSAKENIVFKAYNRFFDEGFLKQKPWEVPAFKWGECIMKQAASQLTGKDKLKLETAMQLLEIPWPKGRAHDAATDAHAALLVHEKINETKT